ncbi:MAG TPA: CoA-binding protein [Polyangiaceae bacterium]|nr:CoA-binding protein [Polyangiaceae bacterium]
MDTPERVLRQSRIIAVVGCSRNPEKSAHSVPKRLRERGYRIIPVNPNVEEVFGERCFSTLGEVATPVDLVLVFRPSEEAPALAQTAIRLGARAFWLQLGLRSEEARRIAGGAGLDYVEDRCAGVEAAQHGIQVSVELDPQSRSPSAPQGSRG